MCRREWLKSLNFWQLHLKEAPHFGAPKFYLSFIFTYLKNFMYLAIKDKKFEFWRACSGVNLPSWHPQFLLSLVYF